MRLSFSDNNSFLQTHPLVHTSRWLFGKPVVQDNDALYQNLLIAYSAARYAHKHLPLGSGTWKSSQSVFQKTELKKTISAKRAESQILEDEIYEYNKKFFEWDLAYAHEEYFWKSRNAELDSQIWSRFLNRVELSKKYGAGNCQEFTELALKYYHENRESLKKGQTHAVRMKVDHSFLVANVGDSTAFAENYFPDRHTWSPSTVICDPWGMAVYPASLYHGLVNRILTNKDIDKPILNGDELDSEDFLTIKTEAATTKLDDLELTPADKEKVRCQLEDHLSIQYIEPLTTSASVGIKKYANFMMLNVGIVMMANKFLFPQVLGLTFENNFKALSKILLGCGALHLAGDTLKQSVQRAEEKIWIRQLDWFANRNDVESDNSVKVSL